MICALGLLIGWRPAPPLPSHHDLRSRAAHRVAASPTPAVTSRFALSGCSSGGGQPHPCRHFTICAFWLLIGWRPAPPLPSFYKRSILVKYQTCLLLLFALSSSHYYTVRDTTIFVRYTQRSCNVC